MIGGPLPDKTRWKAFLWDADRIRERSAELRSDGRSDSDILAYIAQAISTIVDDALKETKRVYKHLTDRDFPSMR
jgi:hypothetical protein